MLWLDPRAHKNHGDALHVFLLSGPMSRGSIIARVLDIRAHIFHRKIIAFRFVIKHYYSLEDINARQLVLGPITHKYHESNKTVPWSSLVGCQ